MDKSLLVKILGPFATLIHGDTLVLDRWLWLKQKLPRTLNQERLLDVGCGTGAFSILAARRGYQTIGLSWSDGGMSVANERAAIVGLKHKCDFQVVDVRDLNKHKELVEQFDVVVNCENIEHIVDDKKLMINIFACLKPGGRLLLTTPNFYYNPMTHQDLGPFYLVEDGAHVRRGYTKAMLLELCEQAGFKFAEISYCSGFISQKITAALRVLNMVHPLIAWAAIFPFRPLPVLFDKFIKYPQFSICLEAYKPRFD
jgi:2-polyprenyl-3-methyl-5-hydroxy-6-metoxy-1,4-benzoquinol methylase